MKDLIRWMLEHSRGFTKEEAEAYSKGLDSISHPTGRNIFDMMKDAKADEGSFHTEGMEKVLPPEDLNK